MAQAGTLFPVKPSDPLAHRDERRRAVGFVRVGFRLHAHAGAGCQYGRHRIIVADEIGVLHKLKIFLPVGGFEQLAPFFAQALAAFLVADAEIDRDVTLLGASGEWKQMNYS